MTRQRFSAALARAAFGLGLLWPAAPAWSQDTPRVLAGPNGQAEVVFRNGCAVTFDARGSELRQLSVCTRDQRIRARAAVDAWRGGQDGGDVHGRAPDLSVDRDGSIRASFRNGCDIEYDRFGRRIGADRSCGEGHLRRADETIERYRREQGLDGDGGEPSLRAEPDRSIRVSFRNGCDVRYDRVGRRVAEDRSCSDRQLRRADEAVERYRREQGWGAGGGDDRRPQVSLEGNGSGKVEFSDGCTVHYNREGQRRDADRRCSDDQKRRADRLMAVRRQEHGWGLGAGSGGGSGGGKQQVTVGRDGTIEVTMSRSCVVDFDKEGRLLSASRTCTPDERGAASRLGAKTAIQMQGSRMQGEGN